MIVIAESFFVQMVFVFGFVILCGMFISFCNKCFYDACGDAAFPIVRITGFVGTPIHELSHALMCLLFGHTITRMKLVNTDRRSRTLGYVEHTYYKTNLYHQIGNYFIGISPILAGGMAVIFLLWLLVPDVYGRMAAQVGVGTMTLQGVASCLGGMATALFDGGNFADPRFWICLVFSFMVVIHMEISRSDIRSGLRGLGVIAAMILIADLILGFLFPAALTAFTEFCVRIGVFSAFFLMLPSVFSGMIGFLSLVVFAFRSVPRGQTRAVAVNHHRAEKKRK